MLPEQTTMPDKGDTIHVFINCEKGFLHGRLTLMPDSSALAILVRDIYEDDMDTRITGPMLCQDHLSVFEVNLVTRQEVRFPDIHHNVPLLSKRLSLFIDSIGAQAEEGILSLQPYGIFATGHLSPVALRVAATHEIRACALVCCNGLIDLAGSDLLRSLAVPFLMIMHRASADQAVATRRAMQKITCEHVLRDLTADDETEGIKAPQIAKMASGWFLDHFRQQP